MLAGDRYADAVRADEASARALGANAVPFFVIDERYGIAGAQSPAVFANVSSGPGPKTHAGGSGHGTRPG